MPSRLSRRLTALLCAVLLVLTILVSGLVKLPSGLAFNPQPDPPGKQAFNPQPDPPGKQASIIVHWASGDGIIAHD